MKQDNLQELNHPDTPEDILSLKASNKRASQIVNNLKRTVELLDAGMHPDDIPKELTRENK